MVFIEKHEKGISTAALKIKHSFCQGRKLSHRLFIGWYYNILRPYNVILRSS